MKKTEIARVATRILGVALLSLIGTGSGLAQSYPSRPIRLVTAFPPGSTTDVVMRALGDAMRPVLGQAVIVEPKPGAGGIVAVNYSLSQPADGYTVHVYTSSQGIKSAVKNPPFDVRRDFDYIALVLAGPFVLGVNSEKVPARSAGELIEFVRANPGKLNFSNFGSGTGSHLAAVLFARMAKLDVVHVSYNGPAADILALAQGESHASFESAGLIIQQAKAGKIRLLAVSSAERFPLIPELAGMRESGLSGYDFNAIVGLAARTGTPREAINRINNAANEIMKTTVMKDLLAKVSAMNFSDTPEAFGQRVRREVDLFSDLISKANLSIE